MEHILLSRSGIQVENAGLLSESSTCYLMVDMAFSRSQEVTHLSTWFTGTLFHTRVNLPLTSNAAGPLKGNTFPGAFSRPGLHDSFILVSQPDVLPWSSMSPTADPNCISLFVIRTAINAWNSKSHQNNQYWNASIWGSKHKYCLYFDSFGRSHLPGHSPIPSVPTSSLWSCLLFTPESSFLASREHSVSAVLMLVEVAPSANNG